MAERGNHAARSRPGLPRPSQPVPASEQPGNSFRYLYQKLSEKEFQQLCGALLRQAHPNLRCYPVGMSDGGRDAVERTGDGALVYQVKWTSKTERDPVAWLKKAVEGERVNIERLVREEGATQYRLMTSVAGTSGPHFGTMDRLDEELKKLSRAYGIEMQCLWQSDVDSMVDSAPDSLKWSYANMLVGHDLIRYLIDGSQSQGRASETRDILLRVMARQWAEDAKVKFSQVEMDHLNIVDLFVDVEEELVEPPKNVVDAYVAKQQARSEGAAQYLLRTTMPLTLVRGEPGQGKSTLGQYLCQVHRAAILPPHEVLQGKSPAHTTDRPKVALRTDLRDYAAWLQGRDPFEEEPTGKAVRRQGTSRSLESFLAHLCTHYAGGPMVSPQQVQDFLSRYPALILLDGLDEVADHSLRRSVVDEIDNLSQRMATARPFQIIVTTRPNASGLAEPSNERFETVRLRVLSTAMQQEYLRKWAAISGIGHQKRRQLGRLFRERTSEDHIAQLAVNPMQLTILLYLINRRGESVPTARTPLYTQYMETLLDREVEKAQIVKENLPRVQEVTSYLGWSMQGGVESNATAGRQTVKAIERALLVYLHEVDGPVELAGALFTAVSDRFWALSSKVEGTFEFSVQPVREYFAARFLAQYAGLWGKLALKQDVLSQMVGRPYWLNTARFYAGFADPNELPGLADGLADAFERDRHSFQLRVATWTLLADGIFDQARQRVRQQVADLLADNLSVSLLGAGADEMQALPKDRGGREVASAYLERIGGSPKHALARQRVRLLPLFTIERDEFEDWWLPHLRIAADDEQTSTWLTLGASFGGARLPAEVLETLALDRPADAAAALAMSAAPSTGSSQEAALLRAVLDGHASDTSTSSTSEAGDLLKIARPQHFIDLAQAPSTPLFEMPVNHLRPAHGERQNRSSALQRLTVKDARYKRLGRVSAVRKGEKNTTAPWQNTARLIAEMHGPCWLAAEIAIIGAATQTTVTGGDVTSGGAATGHHIDYGTFVEQTRAHRTDLAWWTGLYEAHDDDLSRCTWALALLCVADASVVAASLGDLDGVLSR